MSVATVSHVMNGRAEELGFSPDTAQRVRRAAKAVGYIPRAAARAFRYQSSKVIALFFPDLPVSLRLPVFNEVLTGCIDAARARGHFILPVPISANPYEVVEETLREVELAGAVCRADPSMEPAGELLSRSEVPTAWINTGGEAVPGPGCASLGIDEARGVRDMLDRIDTDSVARPVVLLGPGRRSDRVRPFLERFPQAQILTAQGWLSDDARLSANAAVEQGADLFFTGNDQLGVGVLEVLHERGRNVPGDVQVFSFGDVESGPAALLGLSSVKWPVNELGALAAAAVIEGGSAPSPLVTTLPTCANLRSTTRLR
ncbi:LacI family DNA-binding transcriptional regulator [Actinomyces respiraculi]|uniref:LacI family DNA-binding transcriptional regulator n=1 Tax=Actinomyces respiraculi TaxID=2744574 RepID=A0A7T0LJC5_9ACTO|nr:LacI family DNA-binding transcriptional regulator [Actinomyces respiraculi]